MSLIRRLSDPAEWAGYLAYKREKNHLTRYEAGDLEAFIEEKAYLPVVDRILAGGSFSIPEKKLIRKMQTGRKRTVYVFPREENYVLKLLTFLLIRRYDGYFPDNLYSFRVSRGVKKAMRTVLRTPGLDRLYTYKADISNYFNSIPVEPMLHRLSPLLSDEPETFDLFAKILRDPRVLDRGEVLEEEKGVMAGTPFAVFLANVYLVGLDRDEEARGSFYARYSDDIILFAETEEERERGAERILAALREDGLSVNREKEFRTAPGEAWSFLGISYHDGTVDISPVSADKLKAKMRRKARALRRWQARKGATNEQTAKAFIRSMNRKFFDADSSHELTWTRWYFPLINTDKTLHVLDRSMQDWVRYLATGTHAKSRFRFRYEDLKRLGYVSLVHAWYRGKEAPEP